VLPPGEPVEPRLDVLRRRELRGLLDDREQPGIDLVAAIEVGREPRADAAEEDRAPAVVGRGPRGLGALDRAAELAERARGLRGRGARSEERRVGKECRLLLSPYYEKQNVTKTRSTLVLWSS